VRDGKILLQPLLVWPKRSVTKKPWLKGNISWKGSSKFIDEEEGATVTTTGVHGAGRLGKAIHSDYRGEYKVQYLENERLNRISWER
jgi:hypothetical protein